MSITAVSPEAAAPSPPVGPPAPNDDAPTRPVFLVGAERSGTTMLRLMLNANPHIAWQCEFHTAIEPLVGHPLHPGGDGWPDADAYRLSLSSDGIFHRSGLHVPVDATSEEILRGFPRQVWQRKEPKPDVVGITCHRFYDVLDHLWPESRFVHVVRDPREVAASWLKLGWAGHVWFAADHWLEAEELWEKVKPTIAEDRRHEIIFEELIFEPERVLSDLCAFLGVPYSPAMLEYHESSTYKPVSGRVSGKWRNKITPAQAALLDTKLGRWLDQYGHGRALPVDQVPPPARRLRLLQHRPEDPRQAAGHPPAAALG